MVPHVVTCFSPLVSPPLPVPSTPLHTCTLVQAASNKCRLPGDEIETKKEPETRVPREGCVCQEKRREAGGEGEEGGERWSRSPTGAAGSISRRSSGSRSAPDVLRHLLRLKPILASNQRLTV